MKITRIALTGTAVAMLVVATVSGYSIAQSGVKPRFDDVPPEHYAFEAASWAADLGITVGCGDGSSFCPGRTLTRAEMVTFLYRYDRSTREPAAVERAPAVPVEATDFYTLYAGGNRSPEGIWSDGTTMWVADSGDGKIYAYDMATKAPKPSKDLRAHGRTGAGGYAPTLTPKGIWSDGTTMWVATAGLGDEISAYNLATKAREPSKTISLLRTDNRDPEGIWSDGTTMWVADSDDGKVYAYDLATTAPQPSKDLFLRREGGFFSTPTGIWSDGTTMWIAGVGLRSLLAYDVATGDRDPSEDFTDPLLGGGNALGGATGIWSDGTTMWVVNWLSNEVFAYDMATKRYVGGAG